MLILGILRSKHKQVSLMTKQEYQEIMVQKQIKRKVRETIKDR